jgi:hypothetical protein
MDRFIEESTFFCATNKIKPAGGFETVRKKGGHDSASIVLFYSCLFVHLHSRKKAL